ncbi:protein-tyrosine phosphatase-like protein [Lipomyces japonicus]|uniref:protein-tyrosine phosphatase-like protein n=1 Tax=Lipomyces japonicus TaxID=56871 RepID=UPI0034CD97E1
MSALEKFKITQVLNVQMVRRGVHSTGALHLTTHHLIFRENSPSNKEVWVCYPILAYVERRPYSAFTGFSAIRIRCRDFSFIAFHFQNESESKLVFETLQLLTCLSSVDNLYAFYYHPGSAERSVNTWDIYDPVKEFQRLGVGSTADAWRFTSVNENYQFCPSYPKVLVVPSSISDSVLQYVGRYRSKARIPALSYIHKLNNCTITRSSQPLVGLKQNRSPQDEGFVRAIFSSTLIENAYGASQENLIADARPTTNAIAQTALGAGSENMENYRSSRKVYLGIDNIHVMRDSLNKVYEALKDSDITPLPPNRELLYKSGWLKHISTIIEGAVLMGKRLHLYHSHVLVHCSDGWDRTAQLSSLAQIFLDPYFRTIDGFMVLVEKEWLAFGHRFAERCGHLSSEKVFVQTSDKTGGGNSAAHQAFNNVITAAKNAANGGGSNATGTSAGLKYTAPVFHQFLDCVYQLLRQFPDRFEFTERFLRRMLYHLYSCQYGNFLYNCEREREEARVEDRAQSVWDYFVVRRKEFLNPKFDPSLDYVDRGANSVIFPDPKRIQWWHEVFGRTEEEMSVVTLNGIGSSATASRDVQRQRAHATQQRQESQQQYQQAFDQFKEVANSKLASWASSIASSSKELAHAASPYLQTLQSSSLYADAVEDEVGVQKSQSTPELGRNYDDNDEEQKEKERQDALRRLAALNLDPLDSYSITHRGSEGAYVDETR